MFFYHLQSGGFMFFLKKHLFFFFYQVTIVLFLASQLYSQSCLTDTLRINTGYNPNTGGTIPIGQNDPFWTVISDPLPNTNEPRPASTIWKHPAWSNPYPNSQWIAVYSSYSNNTNGIYEYERCFCIERQGRIRIRLQVLADDSVAVFLNGNYIGGSFQTGYTGQFVHPLLIDTVLMVNQGRNCFRFVVGNVGSIAHGLNVSGILLPLGMPSNILADSCCDYPGYIYGQKFNDLNCNGKPDYGEPILQNWAIVIQGIQGTNFSDTVFTGSDGYFSAQVPPGCYNVFEIQQPGWVQTYPQGNQQVCVHSAEIITLNFLNCQQPPCDTLGSIEFDSSCCRATIPVFNIASGPLQQINWQILNNSGTMESIAMLSSCSSSLIPSNPYGTTSGTISFAPSGCTSNPLLIMEANSTTASGIVTIAFEFIHNGQICRDTINLHCPRAPQTKCDSLVVTPFTWTGLNLSGRTFTIFNQKQPTSPIKEIQIQLTPDPFPSDPNFKWNGGGLIVDGINRPWAVTNSGTPYYSLISLDCNPNTPPPAPQGNAANNTVKFNLGVDYTLGWTGNVILTIIHCDGDTCVVTYNNWCAKPPKQCITVTPIPIDSVQPPKNLVASSVKFNINQNVKFILVELSKEQRSNNQLIGAIAGVLDEKNNIVATGKTLEYYSGTDESIPKTSTVIEIPEYISSSSGKECRLISFFISDSSVKFNVILFDENVNPIGYETFEASQQVSSVNLDEADFLDLELLKISPNPTKEGATLEYFTPIEGNISIQIIDILGNSVKTIETGRKTFGLHRINFNTYDLASGTYTILLKLPNGKVLRTPLLITK